MKPVYAMFVLSLAQLAGSSDACAQVSAQATLSHIGISLTDLAPDDGIAPSYTYSQWFAGYDQAETRIEYGPAPGWSSGALSDSGEAPWANHQLAFDSASVPAHAGSHLTGATRRSGNSLQTLELFAASEARGSGSAWIQSNATSYIYGMTLSPHTALRLTFQVDVLSSVATQPAEDDFGYAAASVRIDFTAVEAFEDVVQSHMVYHALDGVSEFGTAGTQFVTIDFANTSATRKDSILSLVADAYSVAPAPVPEASTYAMLAAGLGVLGGLSALRRRQALRSA